MWLDLVFWFLSSEKTKQNIFLIKYWVWHLAQGCLFRRTGVDNFFTLSLTGGKLWLGSSFMEVCMRRCSERITRNYSQCGWGHTQPRHAGVIPPELVSAAVWSLAHVLYEVLTGPRALSSGPCVWTCFSACGTFVISFHTWEREELVRLTYFRVIAVPWETISQATSSAPCLCMCVCGWLCLAVGLLEKDTIVAEEAWKFGEIWFCPAFLCAAVVYVCVAHPLCIHPSIRSIISIHSHHTACSWNVLYCVSVLNLASYKCECAFSHLLALGWLL